MIRTIQELDDMRNQAVVMDRDCRVWQKDSTYLSPWFTIGESLGYPASEIALPARLLDDGL